MADINKLKDKIRSTIYPNGKGAINASDHQAMLLDMADGMAETDTKLAELSLRTDAQNERIESYRHEIHDEVDQFEKGIIEQVNNYKPVEITGDVVNAADEEDITSEDNLLKLKNRNSLNGLGYIILRRNKSLANQMVLPNTIYEVRYTFALEDKISLPQNAIIKFNGGKFVGGTIAMNNTTFEDLVDDVFDGVRFEGSTKTKNIKASYFSIHPTISKEDVVNNQANLDCLSEFISCMEAGVNLSFETGFYGFGGEEKQPSDLFLGSKEYGLYRKYALYINTPSQEVLIDGNGAAFINMVNNHYGCWDTSVSPFVAYTSASNINNSIPYHTMGGGIIYFFSRQTKSVVRIHNVNGDYNEQNTLGGNTFISSTQSGFEIGDDIKFLSIKNCNISNNITDAINITGNCDIIEIDECILQNSGRSNLSVSDTAISINITNSNFINSGDWDENLNFRWEGVGAAINLEPIKSQSGRAEISNCFFDRYAYTAITMGATGNNSFDVVSIKGCRFENDKLGRTISNNKVTELNNLAACCVGRVNKEVSIYDCILVNTSIALEKFQQTSGENTAFEYVRLNRLMLSISSDFYAANGSKPIFLSDFNKVQPRRQIVADNIYIWIDNGASIKLTVDATISGTKERDNSVYVGNVFCLLNDHNTYGGVSASSEIIENLHLVNHEKLTASYVKIDYQMAKACKNIYYIDAANSGFVPFMIDSTRTIKHASMKNVGKLASNNIDANFIYLSNDSWRTILFGCSSNPNTISFLPKNSVIIRDPSSLQGEQLGTLFSVINNDSNLSTGTEKYFYGVRKGLPFGATDISSISGYVPELGEMCFDKVSKKPYWWNGSNWVDASGNIKTL